MTTDETPPGAQALTDAGVRHEVVDTTGVRSAAEAAERHGIAVGALVKTIVVRRGEDDFLFVLVPGDRVIDWPKLRAHLGVSRLSMPDADEAREVTGYERGAITPYGATTALPVIADVRLTTTQRVGIGSGRRGRSLQLATADLLATLAPDVADVTVAA